MPKRLEIESYSVGVSGQKGDVDVTCTQSFNVLGRRPEMKFDRHFRINFDQTRDRISERLGVETRYDADLQALRANHLDPLHDLIQLCKRRTRINQELCAKRGQARTRTGAIKQNYT